MHLHKAFRAIGIFVRTYLLPASWAFTSNNLKKPGFASLLFAEYHLYYCDDTCCLIHKVIINQS